MAERQGSKVRTKGEDEEISMDLGLTETQQMLKSSAREFLESECPPALVRQMEEDERGHPEQVWRQMSALGWCGLAFPEEHGGTGGDFMDLAVLLEEMGRALLPGPFFSTVVLGGLTIMDVGTEGQKREYIPPICEGRTTVALALVEDSATYEPWGVKASARRSGDGYIIDGAKLFVPDGQIADVFLVAARTSEGSDPADGISCFLVPSSVAGIAIRPMRTLAGDKQCEVVLAGVEVPEAALLGLEGKGWPLLERTLKRATAAKSLEMLGGAEAVLDLTVGYAKQRVQFGRPVGSFQAVQHHCANMATEVECCRYVAYQAAWKLTEDGAADREISMAKAWTSRSYQRVCSLAHQCHGAIGFTWDHDLQLYTRRAKAQESLYGGPGYHEDLVGQALGI
jgi:alkylation response protein AidB-like acyl-CoA dehydrogenase